jgi:hypothetical protein
LLIKEVEQESDNENMSEDVLLEDGGHIESEENAIFFHFNEFVHPEVAHLQLGRVVTFFLLMDQAGGSLPMKNFSSED